MKFKWLLACLALSLTSVASFGQYKVYKTENDPLNLVGFQSDGLIEDIIGMTNKVVCTLKMNPEDVDQVDGGIMKIDLSDLNTEHEDRDKEMKGPDYLDVKNYPFATFKILTVSAHNTRKLENGKKVTCHITGDLSLHGVTKTIMIPVTFVYFQKSELTKKRAKGNLLDIFCVFKIKLTDYNIKIPELMAYRIHDDVEIKVNVVLSEFEK